MKLQASEDRPSIPSAFVAIDRVAGYLSAAAGAVAGVAFVAVMLLTLSDVAARSFSGSGVTGTIEYSELLLGIGVFLGLAVAQRNGSQVATSVVSDRLPAIVANRLMATGLLVATLFLVLAAYATIDQAISSVSSSEVRIGLIHVKLWPARIALAIGMLLWLLEIALEWFAVVVGAERNHESNISDLTNGGVS